MTRPGYCLCLASHGFGRTPFIENESSMATMAFASSIVLLNAVFKIDEHRYHLPVALDGKRAPVAR